MGRMLFAVSLIEATASVVAAACSESLEGGLFAGGLAATPLAWRLAQAAAERIGGACEPIVSVLEIFQKGPIA